MRSLTSLSSFAMKASRLHGLGLVGGTVTHGNGAVGDLRLAQDQHVGHAVNLTGGANLVADLLVAVVQLHADALAVQCAQTHLAGIIERSCRRRAGTFTCTGASQVGNLPAKCSVRMPMNRSMEPKHNAVDHDRALLGRRPRPHTPGQSSAGQLDSPAEWCRTARYVPG